MSEPPLCELRGIRKSFPGVQALDGVDFTLGTGEIHALVGENGAGKSTLIRILAGILQPDSGEIRLDGRTASIRSPRAARDLGIAAAHQEPALFLWQTAEENCFNQRGLPGKPFISWALARSGARAALDLLSPEIPLGLPASFLSHSQRQIIALSGALLAEPRLLILDEPTASLSGEEAARLFKILREHRARGRSAVYVSHRLSEVLALADRVTVLRDGCAVLTAESARIDADSLVEAMVGRRIEAGSPRPPDPGGAEVLLQVRGLSDGEGAFRDVSLSVRQGEIVGLYGLVGAGRSEVGQALAGLRRARGAVSVRGRLAYLPEDRLRQGNFPGLSVRENISIASLERISSGPFIRKARERTLAGELRGRLRIRAPDLEAEIETLSGGNQQKALLGRALLLDPEILILDEPTQGIDVGARREVHSLIAGLAGAGSAVLLISSDLPEVLSMSHRVLVLREGRISAEFTSESWSEEAVGRAAFPAAGRGAGEREASLAAPIHRARRRILRALAHREAALILAILAVCISTDLKAPGFLSLSTLRESATNGAALALGALGETLVIASGAIDISLGSILALSATAGALAAVDGWPPFLAILLAVALGTGLGSLNAALSILGRLPPIIATLGTLGIFRGIFLLWKGSDWLNLPEGLLALATDGPLGIPATVWGVGIVAAAVFAFLRWARPGRAILAAGDHPEAARALGIRLWAARLGAFAILGACAGLAGVAFTARFGKVQNTTGLGFELLAIAAAVLGGAHVSGGKGSVPGALLGAALIGILQDARPVWGLHECWQLVAIGSLMVGALFLETIFRRISRGGRP